MSDTLVAEDQPSRFVVGIDLGTTNSAVAYVDTAEEAWRVQVFAVPQLVAPVTVEARDTLPSFHYQPAAGELQANALRLPWSSQEPKHAVGCLARDQGTLVPGRLIASAKSWLSHSGVDRLADLLPWHGAPDVERISPVEASARYLAHLRAAWNHRLPEYPLEEQEVVLTLPASFDEVARELTVKAAAKAELPRVVLIEEPQAAFYAWIYLHRDTWDQLVQPGQKILVCDIGGGTSDFTLIRARQGQGGKVQFQRVAVGEHLILGGDNLDLALAHHLEQRFMPGGKLEPRQWGVLVRTCRQVKETLLAEHPPENYVVQLPGTGSRVIGGGLQVEVTRDEVCEWLVEGFMPRVALGERPQARRSGFQEFGLPYAPDAAITRYLAAFLSAHRQVALDGDASDDHDPARPDVMLFNGGVMGSPQLRNRLVEVVGDWFRGQESWQPTVLQNDRLDLAVARGAAYYGMVRRGQGVRISAGLARTYYLGVDAAAGEPSAMCLAPAGIEPGQTVDLSQREFKLLIRQPVEFPLYVSSVRLTDRAGDVVTVDPEQMTALPPIRTVLTAGKKAGEAESVRVNLHAGLSEIGTLDLWCSDVDSARTWRLQFDVRAATRTDIAGHSGLAEQQGIVDQRLIEACNEVLWQVFASDEGNDRARAEGLIKRLAEVSGMPRHEWPPSLLRAMWQTLIEYESGRRRSPIHESRWLNLLGYALRPGYGLALDDWRVSQTWRVLCGKLVHGSPTCRAEWWVLWRRVAGGLPAAQQRGLSEPQIAEVRAIHKLLAKGRGSDLKPPPHEGAELWRLLGSLELVPPSWKIELGNMLLDLTPREKVASVQAAMIWSLGRLGARVPVYGPLNAVVPADVAGDWAERVMALKCEFDTSPLALMELSRRTDDRYRDISPAVRSKVVVWLERRDAPARFAHLVTEGGELEAAEQGMVFGDSLPVGLSLM